MISTYLLLLFTVNLITGAALAVTASNSVFALIALVYVFINITWLLFLLELEFIGLLFLIVYVGAISVLFLFSVLLFNLKTVVRRKSQQSLLHSLLGTYLLYFLAFMLTDYSYPKQTDDWTLGFYNDFIPNLHSELYVLGAVMYSDYSIYLILLGLLLLVAMLGAVILINSSKDQIQMQHAAKQISRNTTIINKQ